MPLIDITNKRFKRILVLSYDHSDSKKSYWKVQCDCGKIFITRSDSLRSGKTKSCGCLQKEKAKIVGSKKAISEIGNIYGKLTIIDYGYNVSKNKKRKYWTAKCECGAIVNIRGSHLRGSSVISCGCVNSKGEEAIAKILKDNNIEFEKQYQFNNLKGIGKRSLKFDFAIKINGILSHLVEYDGEQHYNMKSKFYSDKVVKHDKLKDEYCQKNNIRLIRLRSYDNLTIKDLL
jgi:hypothetical protein